MTDDLAISVPSALAGQEPVDVALVLGSGFSGVADGIEDPVGIPFASIEGFPMPERQVPGHAGRLLLGELGGRRVACFQGRIHRYQGFSGRDVAYPARLSAALGARTLIVTNAAGGVDTRLDVGDVVLISDHINLMGDNPLVGWPGPPGGNPFVPMHGAYAPELRAVALEAAAAESIEVTEGVYAGLLGPSFETPAEVAYLRAIGADVVGMSTVPEVIAARALGMKVLGLSLVANAAAGATLSHEEVLEEGVRAQETLTRLLIAILRRL